MAGKNGFRYEISWEKDESDTNLEYEKLSAYVPGVTHLGKKNQKPSKNKPPKSTQSSSKYPQRQTLSTKVSHDVKGREVIKEEDTISLKNLRPQDKKRIANLIKELAKVGEEKDVAMQQLAVERKEFEVKYIDLQSQMNSLKTERESLQHQYLQCQKLLLECQKRLGREQAKHQQYLKSGKRQEKEFLQNRSLQNESKKHSHHLEPVPQDRAKEQFQPQMQSTVRVFGGPESFTHPMNGHHLPPNQQAAAHQAMNNYEMNSNHYSQHGHLNHQGNVRAAQQFQDPGRRAGPTLPKGTDANLLSPSVFSPDEFHPLPEELINSKSFEAVESGRFRSPSVPRGDRDSRRLETRMGGPSQSRLNENEDQRNSNGMYVRGQGHPLPSDENRTTMDYMDYVQEGTKDGETSYGYQREYSADFHSGGKRHPEGQGSSRSFYSEDRDGLLRKGPISEMIQRQRQLEEQKMLLRREQEWLQKQLRDQEELLYQKQMELEAHKNSLLIEDHIYRGNSRGGGTSEGQGKTVLESKERVQHLPSSRGESGPTSHREDFQQYVEKDGDITRDKGGRREVELIHGSVLLHEDGSHQRFPPGPPANTTVDASTSPLQASHQQIEKSIGVSPAIHHPHSRLLEDSSADSSPVQSPDKKFPVRTHHTVEVIPVKDSHFLDDLIEELNSLPSESSNGPDTMLHQAAPIRTLPDKHRSGPPSFHKPQHTTTTLSTSHSSRLYGSEIVSSTDEEEESQLLDDIFFLN